MGIEAVLCCVLVVVLVQSATAAGSSSFFLVFTDIHIDPFYGAAGGLNCNSNTSVPLGTVGCDSPFALLDSGT